LDFVRDGVFAFGDRANITPVVGFPRAVDEFIDRCVGSRKPRDDGEVLLTCFGKVFASDRFAVCDIDDRFVSGEALTNLGDEFLVPGSVCAVAVENITDGRNATVSHTEADVELFEVAISIAAVSFSDGEIVLITILFVLAMD